ncbi:MAG: CPBP family intramembrane metalloprotease [Acidocella sp.]|nr:CPBP family intramembrane metalloprotease [Acidocella sp.]
MMRIVIGTVWSSLFACIGLGLGGLFERQADHVAIIAYRGLLPLLGMIIGLIGFNWCLQSQWLPGVRVKSPISYTSYTQLPAARRWGVAEAVKLLVGFILMQGVGVAGMAFVVGVCAALAHIHPSPHLNPIAATLAGYLTATWWSVWYINRLGPVKLHDGSPSGIGWCTASSSGYATAALWAGVIIMLVITIMHFFPPDIAALQKLQAAKLLETAGPWKLGLLVLAVFIAPPAEEYIFRGGIFAALASRVSPLWAGVITTILFMAVHAPEKIHYPVGFIDVGLVGAAAAWMRVRFASIKPGILLHVLYNAGLLLGAGLAH